MDKFFAYHERSSGHNPQRNTLLSYQKEAPRLFVDVTPLRTSRNFRLLLIGQFVSLLGGNLAIVSVVYRVYQRTSSSLRVGVVSFTQFPLSRHQFATVPSAGRPRFWRARSRNYERESIGASRS